MSDQIMTDLVLPDLLDDVTVYVSIEQSFVDLLAKTILTLQLLLNKKCRVNSQKVLDPGSVPASSFGLIVGN